MLGLLAYRTYEKKAPIPDRVVDPSGQTVYSGNDIRAGVLVSLAGLVLCVEVFRNHAPADLVALALPAAVTMIVGPRLVAGFVATPSQFPDDGRDQIVSGTISMAPEGHSFTHRPQPLQKS